MVNLSYSREEKDFLLEKAFGYFRSSGFPYPDLRSYELWEEFIRLKKTRLNVSANVGFGLCGKKLLGISAVGIDVCNYFNKHIFDSHAFGMKSPVESFSRDSSLRKAISLVLEYDPPITSKKVLNKLRIVSGTQMCSNFRPSVAKFVYDLYLPCGGLTIDPSMGYGGRLLGFLASNNGGRSRYLGVDPNEATCFGNRKMVEFFDMLGVVDIICSPFEDLSFDGLKGEVDLVFTSPPYFIKEIYVGGNHDAQSAVRYSDYFEWVDKFLFRLIENSFIVLKMDGKFVLNVNNIRINNKLYSLLDDVFEICDELGFKLLDRYEMSFSRFGNNLDKFVSEPLLVFGKEGV